MKEEVSPFGYVVISPTGQNLPLGQLVHSVKNENSAKSGTRKKGRHHAVCLLKQSFLCLFLPTFPLLLLLLSGTPRQRVVENVYNVQGRAGKDSYLGVATMPYELPVHRHNALLTAVFTRDPRATALQKLQRIPLYSRTTIQSKHIWNG